MTEIDSIETVFASLANAVKKVHFPETDADGNPMITRFFLDNGRYPHITDEIKPWHYKGWLLMYVQETYYAVSKVMHIRREQMKTGLPVPPLPKELNFGAICDRWSYYFRQIDAGCITDEEIPQIEFFGATTSAAAPGLKMLEKTIADIEYLASSWNIFGDFVDWFAFALGVSSQKSRFNDKVQEHLYRNFDASKLLIAPADYLGYLYSESKVNRHNKTGFYPTPSSIVECMVRMVFPDMSNVSKFDTVNDCCVGTGRMLLHASNYSLRLSGQDIDPICVKICLINSALYAPWMAFPFPKEFFAEHDKLKKEKTAQNRPVLKPAPETIDISSEALNASHALRNETLQPNLIDMSKEDLLTKKTAPLRKSKTIVLNEDLQGKLFEF